MATGWGSPSWLPFRPSWHGNGACCHGNRLPCHGNWAVLDHVTKLRSRDTWPTWSALVTCSGVMQNPQFSILLLERFLWKMDFLARKKFSLFEKWIHFLILLKNEPLPASGGLRPRSPCVGAFRAVTPWFRGGYDYALAYQIADFASFLIKYW